MRAAGNIDLEDVRKASAEAAPAGDVSVAKLEADGGLAVTLQLRKEGEDTWVSLEASGADGDAKKTAEEITQARRRAGSSRSRPTRPNPSSSAAPTCSRRAESVRLPLLVERVGECRRRWRRCAQCACALLSAVLISLPRQA